MYATIAIGLMIVLPVLSVIVESLWSGSAAGLAYLIGKWFTFWGIGVRLLVAGLNQVGRPGFTSKGIFGIDDPGAETLVTELGHANLAFGLIGVLSLPFPSVFLTAAAVAGSVFLALDGVLHLRRGERGTNETIAMVTDLVVPAAVLVYLIGTYALRS